MEQQATKGSNSELVEAGADDPRCPLTKPDEPCDSFTFPFLYLQAHFFLFPSCVIHKWLTDKVTVLPLITELENWRKKVETRMPNWRLTQPPHYTDGETETQRKHLPKVGPMAKASLGWRLQGS